VNCDADFFSERTEPVSGRVTRKSTVEPSAAPVGTASRTGCRDERSAVPPNSAHRSVHDSPRPPTHPAPAANGIV